MLRESNPNHLFFPLLFDTLHQPLVLPSIFSPQQNYIQSAHPFALLRILRNRNGETPSVRFSKLPNLAFPQMPCYDCFGRSVVSFRRLLKRFFLFIFLFNQNYM